MVRDGWEKVKLLDRCTLLNGLTYTPSNIKDIGLLVLRSSNVQMGKLCFTDNVYVDCTIPNEKYIKKGDIVICVRNGSAALLGKCAQAENDLNATFGAFMAVLRGNHNDLIFQILQEGSIQKRLLMNSGATINQITKKDFEEIYILVPKKAEEEQKIAIALSDMDTLISNLEQLIEKKKNIKQGVMQELLTGKKRLPGFTKQWKHKKLGNICTMYSGGTPSSKNTHYYGGDILWASITDITNAGKYIYTTQNKLTDEGFSASSTRLYPANTLLFAMYASIGKCCIALKPMCSSQAILGIYDLKDCALEFLYYVMAFNEKKFLEMGQTGTQSNLSKRIMEQVDLYLPEIEEQLAIAEILKDLDAEISKFNQKLSKYRQLKQGMMQKLLTGEIRLK